MWLRKLAIYLNELNAPQPMLRSNEDLRFLVFHWPQLPKEVRGQIVELIEQNSRY